MQHTDLSHQPCYAELHGLDGLAAHLAPGAKDMAQAYHTAADMVQQLKGQDVPGDRDLPVCDRCKQALRMGFYEVKVRMFWGSVVLPFAFAFYLHCIALDICIPAAQQSRI